MTGRRAPPVAPKWHVTHNPFSAARSLRRRVLQSGVPISRRARRDLEDCTRLLVQLDEMGATLSPIADMLMDQISEGKRVEYTARKLRHTLHEAVCWTMRLRLITARATRSPWMDEEPK